MSRSRSYVFTYNNYSTAEYERICALECVYLSVGEEVGASGTPHLQGFIYFKSQRSFDAVRKLLCCHVEIAKSLGPAILYTQKDGKFFEKGKRPQTQEEKGVGEKKRYERAWELAKEGKIEEIDADIRVRHFNTLKKIRAEYQVVPESIEVMENEWYWGKTGTGKSRKAREENPGAYIKNANRWWDGYVDQDVVIIDEWSPSHHVLADYLKKWADHHPFAAETKGGMLCIRPKKLIITSNYAPSDCFEKEEDLEPIRRRFKITHFNTL